MLSVWDTSNRHFIKINSCHAVDLFGFLFVHRTCPVVTTVVSMARAVRKAFRESYVDRCGPFGVQLCTKYRLHVFLTKFTTFKSNY